MVTVHLQYCGRLTFCPLFSEILKSTHLPLLFLLILFYFDGNILSL